MKSASIALAAAATSLFAAQQAQAQSRLPQFPEVVPAAAANECITALPAITQANQVADKQISENLGCKAQFASLGNSLAIMITVDTPNTATVIMNDLNGTVLQFSQLYEDPRNKFTCTSRRATPSARQFSLACAINGQPVGAARTANPYDGFSNEAYFNSINSIALTYKNRVVPPIAPAKPR